MNYTVVTPRELLGIIKRAKRVKSEDSIPDRIVGFKCDGKLWGFKVSDDTTHEFFKQRFTLHEQRKTCSCCGHTHVDFLRVTTPLAPEVLLLKTREGRKSLEKERS